MPIPTSISDLNTTAASNSPAGSDSPTEGDNYIRALSAIVAQEHADFASTSDTSKGDALVGVKLNATGAVATTQHQVNEERVSVFRFMSAAQIADSLLATPTLDCSAALQAAVTHCLAQSSIPVLEIPGLLRIATPVNIDRQIDTTLTDFRIVATNSRGGFYVDSAINVFSSTISHTTSPVSEQVSFEGINFVSSDSALAAYAVNGNKFLRMKFWNCYFRKMKCAVSTNYLQTYHFDHCQAREWNGWFLDSVGSYDISVTHCIFEDGVTSGGKGFRSHDSGLVLGTIGCRAFDNLFEGCTGPFVKWTTAYGCSVEKNYFEENTLENIDLSEGRTHGVSVIGNMFAATAAGVADSDYYEVTIGECFGFTGFGNYSNSRLYDFTNAQATARIGGDNPSVALYRGKPSIVLDGETSSLSAAANVLQVRGKSTGVASLMAHTYNGTYAAELFASDGGVVGLYVTKGGTDLLLGTDNTAGWRIKTGTPHLLPEGDNTQNFGSASKRAKEIFAGTGTINTSDENQKQDIEPIPQAWLEAWSDVQWSRFKFKDSVAKKGDGARWHVGLIAQRVRSAFESHGIDPFAIGLLCYDKWDGGEAYGIRYDEALALECAYLRSRG